MVKLTEDFCYWRNCTRVPLEKREKDDELEH